MEIDHADAWDLAHHREESSNLARCYIDLRKAVRQALADGVPRTPGTLKLQEIDATYEDGTVKTL